MACLSADEIAKLISQGNLTERDKGSDKCTPLNNMSCRLCWRYFHRLNQLACCNAFVCTECLETSVGIHKSYADVKCPFGVECVHGQIGEIFANVHCPEEPDEKIQQERKEALNRNIDEYIEMGREIGVDEETVRKMVDAEIIDDPSCRVGGDECAYDPVYLYERAHWKVYGGESGH